MSSDSSKFSCDLCDVKFAHRKSVYQHKRKMHNLTVTVPGNFRCDVCNETFHSHKALVDHISAQHQDANNIDEYFFTSEEEFEEWRNDLESRTRSLYVIQNCYTVNKVDKRTILRCNKYGDFIPKRGNKVRKSKVLDISQIGRTCTAQIKATRHPDGTISVSHFSTHRGHPEEESNQQPKKDVKEDDKSREQEKFPSDTEEMLLENPLVISESPIPDDLPETLTHTETIVKENIIEESIIKNEIFQPETNEEIIKTSEVTNNIVTHQEIDNTCDDNLNKEQQCLNYIITNEDLEHCGPDNIPELIDPGPVVEEVITSLNHESINEPDSSDQSKIINKGQYLVELLQDNQLNSFTLNHIDKYLDDAIELIKVHTNQRNYFHELLKKNNIKIEDDDFILETKRNKTS